MKLTIFTPVYNRRELILELYKSLEKQTCKDFIWLVVDDGSIDGTGEIVQSLVKDASFRIQYYYQNNQGKHAAHNVGVAMCETELFVCVDSDDLLYDDAVERILNVNHQYKNDNVLGFYFRKVDTNGKISGGTFKVSQQYVGLRDLYHKMNFKGELVIVLKTRLIKGYKFPIFENEKFVSELVFYNEINKLAPMVWIDEVIYQFEYQDSGYTKNSNRLIKNNPYGTAYGYLSETYYATSIKDRIKAYAEFCSMCKVFSLNKNKLIDKKVHIGIRLLANVLIVHYNKLFRKIKLGER